MFLKNNRFFKLLCSNNILKSKYQYNFSNKALILGIETSCDDTGCAIVDTEGNILGEAVHCQEPLHIKQVSIIIVLLELL